MLRIILKRCLAIMLCLVIIPGVVSMTGCNGGFDAEKKAAAEYKKYITDLETFPVSFKYERKEYYGFKEGFTEKSRNETKEEKGVRTVIELDHELSGALFKIDAFYYTGYAAYEWTVYITNDGDEETGTFSRLNSADITYKGNDHYLKGINGDLGDMYAPYSIKLDTNLVVKDSTTGRPTHGNFPYFNLEHGDGGTFIAVGWPGTWRASFENDGKETRFTAGQHNIETHLKPGETIRTPLMAFLRYSGRDESKAMNLWRRWYIDCILRHFDGEPFQPVMAISGMSQGTSTRHWLSVLEEYNKREIYLDCLWMDAGWYYNASGAGCSWPETGSHLVNVDMFPDKFADISKAVNEQGGKTMLWFEPEVARVNKDDFLANNPEFEESWFLGVAAGGSWLEGNLIDLGNEQARKWLVDKISGIMEEGGISWYRQDFNVNPAPVWVMCDFIDREGITENKYVQGYLAFWDELIERNPDMMIDSCASGGGRNDLETMKRSVPLHVSDFWDGRTDGIDERQAVMMSLSQWIPYFKLEGSFGENTTLYALRSCYSPWINTNIPVWEKDDKYWNILDQVCDEWNIIKEYFYSDFYPLTECSKATDVWRGWEFFDEEKQEGYFQVFRAVDSKDDKCVIKLKGLSSNKKYLLKSVDGAIELTGSGKDLMKKGIEITLKDAGSSVVIMISQK